jgi:uncharacterized protein
VSQTSSKLSHTLRLAPGLSLPADVATETFLNVGKRGSGKSTTAARLVEQLHGARIPFIVLDPVDTWWGLKASRNGGPGLSDVYVFGGRKADLPLEPGGGVLLAETVCEHRISAVLSCKHLSGRARGTFMADFARTLFQKWSRGALHVVLEEAHELAPQSPYSGEEEMLGAFKRLWKLGRASGIGGTAITQRPAALHKDITTQAEILIVHRTIGPQDVAAVREWIKYHGEQEKILPELASLADGEAFVWAPDFPKGDPVGLKRVRILPRETFDSASTPKVGQHRTEPKRLAQADLAKLRERMASTIERAKAEDPRELKRKVADLQAQISKAEKRVPVAAAPKRVEVPVVSPAEARRLAIAVHRMDKTADKLREAVAVVHGIAADLAPALRKVAQPATTPLLRREIQAAPAPHTVRAPIPARAAAEATGEGIGAGERRVLTAIAQYPQGASRNQLTVLTGYKRSSRDTYISRLRAAGLVEIFGGGSVVATNQGLVALGSDFSPLPTGDALRAYWMDRLPKGEAEILHTLVSVWPQGKPRDTIEGYKRSSRDAYLSRLEAKRLVQRHGPGIVRASDQLFEAGA